MFCKVLWWLLIMRLFLYLLVLFFSFQQLVTSSTVALVGYVGYVLSYDLKKETDCLISSVKILSLDSQDDSVPYWLSISSFNVLTMLPQNVGRRRFFIMLIGKTIGYYVKLCHSFYLEINISHFLKLGEKNDSKTVDVLNALECINSSSINFLTLHVNIPFAEQNKPMKMIQNSEKLSSYLNISSNTVQLLPYNSHNVLHKLFFSTSLHATQTFQDIANSKDVYSFSWLLNCRKSTHEHRHSIFRRDIQNTLKNLRVASLHLLSGSLQRNQRDIFFKSIDAFVGTPIETLTSNLFTTVNDTLFTISSTRSLVFFSATMSNTSLHSLPKSTRQTLNTLSISSSASALQPPLIITSTTISPSETSFLTKNVSSNQITNTLHPSYENSSLHTTIFSERNQIDTSTIIRQWSSIFTFPVNSTGFISTETFLLKSTLTNSKVHTISNAHSFSFFNNLSTSKSINNNRSIFVTKPIVNTWMTNKHLSTKINTSILSSSILTTSTRMLNNSVLPTPVYSNTVSSNVLSTINSMTIIQRNSILSLSTVSASKISLSIISVISQTPMPFTTFSSTIESTLSLLIDKTTSVAETTLLYTISPTPTMKSSGRVNYSVLDSVSTSVVVIFTTTLVTPVKESTKTFTEVSYSNLSSSFQSLTGEKKSTIFYEITPSVTLTSNLPMNSGTEKILTLSALSISTSSQTLNQSNQSTVNHLSRHTTVSVAFQSLSQSSSKITSKISTLSSTFLTSPMTLNLKNQSTLTVIHRTLLSSTKSATGKSFLYSMSLPPESSVKGNQSTMLSSSKTRVIRVTYYSSINTTRIVTEVSSLHSLLSTSSQFSSAGSLSSAIISSILPVFSTISLSSTTSEFSFQSTMRSINDSSVIQMRSLNASSVILSTIFSTLEISGINTMFLKSAASSQFMHTAILYSIKSTTLSAINYTKITPNSQSEYFNTKLKTFTTTLAQSTIIMNFTSANIISETLQAVFSYSASFLTNISTPNSVYVTRSISLTPTLVFSTIQLTRTAGINTTLRLHNSSALRTSIITKYSLSPSSVDVTRPISLTPTLVFSTIQLTRTAGINTNLLGHNSSALRTLKTFTKTLARSTIIMNFTSANIISETLQTVFSFSAPFLSNISTSNSVDVTRSISLTPTLVFSTIKLTRTAGINTTLRLHNSSTSRTSIITKYSLSPSSRILSSASLKSYVLRNISTLLFSQTKASSISNVSFTSSKDNVFSNWKSYSFTDRYSYINRLTSSKRIQSSIMPTLSSMYSTHRATSPTMSLTTLTPTLNKSSLSFIINSSSSISFTNAYFSNHISTSPTVQNTKSHIYTTEESIYLRTTRRNTLALLSSFLKTMFVKPSSLSSISDKRNSTNHLLATSTSSKHVTSIHSLVTSFNRMYSSIRPDSVYVSAMPKSTDFEIDTTFVIPSSTISSTTSRPSYGPVLIKPIGQIFANTGRLFYFKVPDNTFFDQDDGGTENLTLNAYTNNGESLDTNNWLFYNISDQSFTGVPLLTDFKDQGHKGNSIRLVATDKAMNDALDTFQIIIMEPIKILTFTISVTLAFDFKAFLAAKLLRRDLIERIARFYGNKLASDLYIDSITEGSTIMTWSNTSTGVTTCNQDEIQTTIDAVQIHQSKSVSGDFVRYLLPDFPVIGISSRYLGACLTNATKQPITETIQANDSFQYLYYIVPVTVLGVIVVIILLVFLFLWRQRKKKYYDTGRIYERGKPVLLPDELELKAYPDPVKFEEAPKSFSNKGIEHDELDGVSLRSESSSTSYLSSDFELPADLPPKYVMPPLYKRPTRSSQI